MRLHFTPYSRLCRLRLRRLSMKICMGVTGSIAAYRSPDLVKELIARGHDVQVVLTAAAKEFVSPRVLSTVSGHPVLSENVFAEDHSGTDHISLARWADCFLIFAASASFMARYANGIADDFLTLQLLAAECPVYIAPAMNPSMWNHPALQENYRVLQSRGVQFIGPIHGKVTCGEVGVGHVASMSEILERFESAPLQKGFLEGKKLLISAGPMRTSLDPVRYVQNRSSGKMGLEIARAATQAGAKVSVLLGPVDASIAKDFTSFLPESALSRYTTAEEYGSQLGKMFPDSDIFMSLAAVLDFEFLPHDKKIERETIAKSPELKMPMKSVRDFVAHMASLKKPHQKVIAFAAETGSNSEVLTRGRLKRDKKSVDALVANPVRPGVGPEASENELWVFHRGTHEPIHLGPDLKSSLAEPLLKALFS